MSEQAGQEVQERDHSASRGVQTLQRWAGVTDYADPYMAPERRLLCLRGFLPSGREVVTSFVKERVGPATYRTRSGSLYRLEGPPEPGYAAWCAEHGIALDTSDPVRFIC